MSESFFVKMIVERGEIMMIDEVVDRAMAFIEKDQFSEKWIYTSKLFYKNKLLPLFTDKKEFDSKIIIHLINEYTSMYENSQLSRSTFNSRIRWLRYCWIFLKD